MTVDYAVFALLRFKSKIAADEKRDQCENEAVRHVVVQAN
jgi:hypothetical protein